MLVCVSVSGSMLACVRESGSMLVCVGVRGSMLVWRRDTHRLLAVMIPYPHLILNPKP